MASKHLFKIMVQADDRRSRKDVVGDLQDILDAGRKAIETQIPGIIHVRVALGVTDEIGQGFSNHE